MCIQVNYLYLCFSLSSSCSKTNQIPPVNGVISGKPAVTLYGSSLEPTDYMFIDTVAADKKISYNGNVFTYVYNNTASSNIYFLNSGVPAADATLSLTGPGIVLTIVATYSNTFGSAQYTSR